MDATGLIDREKGCALFAQEGLGTRAWQHADGGERTGRGTGRHDHADRLPVLEAVEGPKVIASPAAVSQKLRATPTCSHCALKAARNARASGRISSWRSRSGGTVMSTTLSR